MIGETIGNFQIVARIGRGGMGEIYLAQQTAIETKVVVKVLLPEVSADQQVVGRFFNEARAVSRIKHAGIVKIFDVGFHGRANTAYLIMEYLEGESLGDRLARVKRLTIPQIIDIGRQIASVLDATHNVGIIHRDLKPDNVYLVPDHELRHGERVKVLDFGIAKLNDSMIGPRTVGAMGTPTYMAPEQWGNASQVDLRADMYALGCVIFEMACGDPPFLATSIPELYTLHLSGEIPSIRERAPDMPPALDTLLKRLLAKDPANRPDSMKAVMRALDTVTLSSYDEPTIVPDVISANPKRAPMAAPLPEPDPASLPSVPDPELFKSTLERARPSNNPNTTLSRASSELIQPPARPSPLIPIVLIAAISVVGAMILIVWAQRHSRHSAASTTSDAASAEIPVTTVVAADAPAELAWPDWERAANPYVAHQGFSVMSHQVTRGEYRRYLSSLPPGAAAQETPVNGWDDSDPQLTLEWMTQEQATRFCSTLGARLPSEAEWKKLSGGKWGYDPTGAGKLGPLQEWTSTVKNDFARVCGGYSRMAPSKLDAMGAACVDKQVRASVKEVSKDTIEQIAKDTIGFRCIR